MKPITLRTALALSIVLPSAHELGWIYFEDDVTPEWWALRLWTRRN